MDGMHDKINQLRDSYKLKIETISNRIADLELEHYNSKERNTNNDRQKNLLVCGSDWENGVFPPFQAGL